MKAEGVLQYLNKPWNPIGRLQLLNATEELPAAFDGIVTIDEYKDMISSVDERASNYRGMSICYIAKNILQKLILMSHLHSLP